MFASGCSACGAVGVGVGVGVAVVDVMGEVEFSVVGVADMGMYWR